MGWLKEHKDRDGTSQYYAIYRDLQGRERSAGVFISKREANKAWRAAEADQDAGRRVGDPKRGRKTFGRYVADDWLPHHVMEASTREGYVYSLNRHILPDFENRRMREILPHHVRSWVLKLQRQGVQPPTIRNCKVILDAVFTTALNDQIIAIHPGKGVKTPPVARKPMRVLTAGQYDRIHRNLSEPLWQLLVETDIETGLRWGELTELRVRDLDRETAVLTISRAVVELTSRTRPDGKRFVVKDYPKDKEWRQVKLPAHLAVKLRAYIDTHDMGRDDLLFALHRPEGPVRRRRPAELPDPRTLGLTTPNQKGRQYHHGTLTAYQAGKCRCDYCKDAIAAYRASRRVAGKDQPRRPRAVDTDGHIPRAWFRKQIWDKALAEADLDFRVTPHGLRHAHASWLLSGGADLQVVKERLGHGSIATTEKYLHSLPNAHNAALKALETFRSQSLEDQGQQASAYAAPVEPARAGNETEQLQAELAELRAMVAKFKEILQPMRHNSVEV